MPPYKLTDEHFEVFKVECLRLRVAMGLLDWEFYFEFKKYKNMLAGGNFGTKWVTLKLNTVWYDWEPNEQHLKDVALHEVNHVLSADLRHMACARSASTDDIIAVDEALVNRLTMLLSGKI